MSVLYINAVLTTLVIAVGTEKRHVVDLTHELISTAPTYPIYDPFNFTIMVREQTEHFWFEYNWIGTVEHMGTHMDAPSHFSKGNLRIHQIPIERFIGPGVIIRVTDKVQHDPDYQMTVDDIIAWENKFGLIPEGAILLMDSGWTHKWPDSSKVYGTSDPKNLSTFHGPALSEAAAHFIVDSRPQVSIIGVDSFSPDSATSVTYPNHVTFLGAGIPILENVANVDQVPEAGAVIHCAPLKIHGGSGSPIRAFAIINDDIMKPEELKAGSGSVDNTPGASPYFIGFFISMSLNYALQ